MPRALSNDEVEAFNRDGLLLLRGFYDLSTDIEPIQRGIYEVIGQVLRRHGLADSRPPFASSTFDAGYLDLIAMNRAWGGEVYDAVKQIPAFVRLVAHPQHEALFGQLRAACLPGVAAGGYGIRIDNPNEDKYRAMWHQEYPAQLRSVDGIVLWSPLVPVTGAMGPVVICPGSHHEGPLPVKYADPDNAGRSGAYALMLAGEADVVGRYPQVAPLTQPGDLLLMDFLVLHASGFNRADRPRWTMQFRYFNFNEPVGRTHGWKGSYAAGVNFADIHPELLVSGEES